MSINLHLNSENNFFINESNNKNLENGENTKIHLTYKNAIDEIYKLSLNQGFRKYFHKILGEEEVEGNPRLLGAAVDKTLGKIFLIVKNQRDQDSSVLQWSVASNRWNRIDSKLHRTTKNFDLINRTSTSRITSCHHEFGWKYPVENFENFVEKRPEESTTYFSAFDYAGKMNSHDTIEYKPIEDFLLQNENEREQNQRYTINYQDIVNRFLSYNSKTKNAYSKINIEN